MSLPQTSFAATSIACNIRTMTRSIPIATLLFAICSSGCSISSSPGDDDVGSQGAELWSASIPYFVPTYPWTVFTEGEVYEELVARGEIDPETLFWTDERKLNLGYCIDRQSFTDEELNATLIDFELQQLADLAIPVPQEERTAYDLMVAAMKNAGRAWEAHGTVNFVHFAEYDDNCEETQGANASEQLAWFENWENETEHRIVFRVLWDGSARLSGLASGAAAFYPSAHPATRRVVFTGGFQNGGGVHNTWEGTILHELGHILGMGHEDDSPECRGIDGYIVDDNYLDSGLVQFHRLTPYDPLSVMGYTDDEDPSGWCSEHGDAGWSLGLSQWDGFGAALQYGDATLDGFEESDALCANVRRGYPANAEAWISALEAHLPGATPEVRNLAEDAIDVVRRVSTGFSRGIAMREAIEAIADLDAACNATDWSPAGQSQALEIRACEHFVATSQAWRVWASNGHNCEHPPASCIANFGDPMGLVNGSDRDPVDLANENRRAYGIVYDMLDYFERYQGVIPTRFDDLFADMAETYDPCVEHEVTSPGPQGLAICLDTTPQTILDQSVEWDRLCGELYFCDGDPDTTYTYQHPDLQDPAAVICL